MYLYIIFIIFIIFILCVIYCFILSKNDNNIILMTGFPIQTYNFLNKVNGIWLLMPHNFDYKNINNYKQNKNILNYYRT